MGSHDYLPGMHRPLCGGYQHFTIVYPGHLRVFKNTAALGTDLLRHLPDKIQGMKLRLLLNFQHLPCGKGDRRFGDHRCRQPCLRSCITFPFKLMRLLFILGKKVVRSPCKAAGKLIAGDHCLDVIEHDAA